MRSRFPQARRHIYIYIYSQTEIPADFTKRFRNRHFFRLHMKKEFATTTTILYPQGITPTLDSRRRAGCGARWSCRWRIGWSCCGASPRRIELSPPSSAETRSPVQPRLPHLAVKKNWGKERGRQESGSSQTHVTTQYVTIWRGCKYTELYIASWAQILHWWCDEPRVYKVDSF